MSSVPNTTPALPDDDRPARRIGLVTVLLVFGVFGGWAALAPLDSAALAPGVITVESYRKTVQHLEGGIIETLQVRDGETVKKDQVLVTLDNTQPKAQLEVLRGEYYIAAAREARLVAQRDGLAGVAYPPDLLARRDDPRVQDAIRVQSQTFAVRKTAHEGEIAVYQRQVEQLKAKANGLRSQRQSRERLVESYRGELKDYASLLEEGFTEKQKVRELERSLAQSEGQLGELVADIAATELQISETELKILQLKKELQREVAKELVEVQAQSFELREKIQSVEATVQRTVVKAPEAGMVMGLAVHTLGAVIQPGGHILDIVPQNEKLIVEAHVSPNDIDRVKVGQQAEIRFTAFKSRETPKIDGRLSSLSADRLVDERQPEAMPYYLARVEVSPEGLKDLAGQHLELVPGMPAEVLINTGARTLLEYLTRPLTDTFARSFIED
ncbi:HlyD family type I secretion periplasmic adaptor subunit [Methylomagnum ishizawai]|uniref:HlyD family type I secretion periplasmic adaptor subunit n=1 Tax=Methylomagnum ishizawai TaxID=1760988 RepID=UPI001C341B83|nr:HlyD family type I secretion periplasmic adaptor subunit [Methylomagnum ishizawai]BBL73924.1 HlyD family type I secretion periplasmic adaptor subunit [Methylomagnum ishizawai]